MFKNCDVCGKTVWVWQKKVKGLDGLKVAHKKCKPEGFHREFVNDAEVEEKSNEKVR